MKQRSVERSVESWPGVLVALTVVAVLSGVNVVAAATGGTWVPHGPAPVEGGGVNAAPNDQIAGATHVAVPHPSDPGKLWIGTVNGGIWRTSNATDANPNWIPLTDPFPGYSIGSIELDPADASILLAGVGGVSAFKGAAGPRPGLLYSTNGGDSWTEINHAKLVGGNFRSVAVRGNVLLAASTFWNSDTDKGGLFRSDDTGTSWDQISDAFGSGLPKGGIFDLVGDPDNPNNFYASVDDDPNENDAGIYFSDDAGETWSKVSNDVDLDDVLTGPGSTCNAEMSIANGRIFAGVLVRPRGDDPPETTCPEGCQVRYIGFSDDGGASWEQMDLPRQQSAPVAITDASNTTPIVITSAGHGLATQDKVTVSDVTGNDAANGTWCITVINSDEFKLEGSAGNGAYGGGGEWTEDEGSNSGGQGEVHFSILADPGNSDIVYIGGDRGKDRYRGDASVAPDPDTVPSPQWSLLESPNANGTAPHADSRDMVFDSNGLLINVDDGGIFGRNDPQSDAGEWISLVGDLQITEIHDIAYDRNSNIIFGGTQDNGTMDQVSTGSPVWKTLFGKDGGDVAVDDTSVAGESTRYIATQVFTQDFKRRRYDDMNMQIQTTDIPLTPDGDSDELEEQFVTPIDLSEADPSAMIIGGCNSVYESFDKGDSIIEIDGSKTCDTNDNCLADDKGCSNDPLQSCSVDGDCDMGETCDVLSCERNSDCPSNVRCALGVNSDIRGNPLLYGHPDNPDLIYIGSGKKVYKRTIAGGNLLPTAADFPGGGNVSAITLDPADQNTVFVADSNNVVRTDDGGASWTDITGNIGNACPSPPSPECASGTFRAIDYIEGPVSDKVVLGTNAGVFASVEPHFDCWFELGQGLPNTLIWDFDYFTGLCEGGDNDNLACDADDDCPDGVCDAAADLLVAGTLGRGAWTLQGIAPIVVPVITIPVGDLDFGTVCLGSTGTLTLEVCNTGKTDLWVDPITTDEVGVCSTAGSACDVDGDCPMGETCDKQFEVTTPSSGYPVVISPDFCFPFEVSFTPFSPGPHSAQLTIPSNDPCRPEETIEVSGFGGTGDINVTGSTEFGDVCAGTQAEKVISVCNTGQCDLTVTDAFLSAVGMPATPCNDFDIINNPFPDVISKDFCIPLTVRFTPTTAGPKTCDVNIESDDPDENPVVLTLSANTPFNEIAVAGDQTFPPEVIQSVGDCSTTLPFPVVNLGICPAEVVDVSISVNPDEYGLSGLPPVPLLLQSGEQVGDGALGVVFAPDIIERDNLGQAKVTWVLDPITGATVMDTAELCGEGVRTGARVLVTSGGVPLDLVKMIKLQRIGANRNGNRLDSIDTARELPLQQVNPDSPCGPFRYHREYGTISNPIQLAAGSYQVTVQARINGRMRRKTVGFDVSTCDFNPTIVVDF
jgi:hypothetical protein